MTIVRSAVIVLALFSMAHVGSPDTFFVGDAGPYRVRVTVRLPGVIPGRAQVNVRVARAAGDRVATSADAFRVSVRAGQWNVGLAGAPPAEIAAPVPGDPALYSAELWLMTATSYELFVTIDGPPGAGTCVVPVLALATAQRTLNGPLAAVLGGLGVFLSVGMLTIIGCAVRESVLPPGVEPDRRRRRRARLAVAAAVCLVGLALWGGDRWWAAEASGYGKSVLYRPFATESAIAGTDHRVLTLSIRDPRWTGNPIAATRYNALMADHGKLMHLFAIREPSMDVFAHVHPVARTPAALDFDVDLPPLPAGRYRVYGDIVHESGYAQTLVSSTEIPSGRSQDGEAVDPDDSWFDGAAAPDAPSPAFGFPDGSTIVWARGRQSLAEREERLLSFSARDAGGAPLAVEPYMGMSAHVIIAHLDGSVFAHLHPNGTISMAALQRFTGDAAQAAHAAHAVTGDLSIPYAFPKSGRYRIWVQMKHEGRIMTAAFETDVLPSR